MFAGKIWEESEILAFSCPKISGLVAPFSPSTFVTMTLVVFNKFCTKAKHFQQILKYFQWKSTPSNSNSQENCQKVVSVVRAVVVSQNRYFWYLANNSPEGVSNLKDELRAVLKVNGVINASKLLSSLETCQSHLSAYDNVRVEQRQ